VIVLKKDIRFNYTWVIVGLCFLSVFVSLGFCSSNRTLYLKAITEALGIPRGAFSLNDTFRYVTTMIVNLFFGVLVHRFGTKKLLCAGFTCLIAFALINATATELYMFYIGGILLGVGLSWTNTTMVSTIINRHCSSNKGALTGAVLAANGLGGALAVQIISPLIFEEGNPFGYRNSYLLVAGILAAVLLLILVLYREKKSENEPVVTKKHKARGEGWEGIEFKEALRKPYFYVALFCIFLTGLTMQGLGGIATPHMYDIGLDAGFVALILSASSLMLTCAKFITGFLFDRKGVRFAANISMICAFVSILCLVFLSNSFSGKVLAFARIPFHAVAMPLETVMLPLFASAFFGNKSFDKVVGIFVSASAAGMAIGSPIANMVFDLCGSYNPAFFAFAISMAVVVILMQYVFIATNRDRKVIEEKE
jgi:MFS family permease